MNETENIELRSEKIKDILGKAPGGIIRYGIGIITLLLACLFLAAGFIPYPERVDATVRVTRIGADGIELSALVPYRFAPRISGTTPVVVRLEGTTAKATILLTGDETVANERGNFVRIVLLVRDAAPGPYGPKVNMRGRASFTLSDKCLFHYLTGWNKNI